jgi:hypothetical protein
MSGRLQDPTILPQGLQGLYRGGTLGWEILLGRLWTGIEPGCGPTPPVHVPLCVPLCVAWMPRIDATCLIFLHEAGNSNAFFFLPMLETLKGVKSVKKFSPHFGILFPVTLLFTAVETSARFLRLSLL